MVVCNALSCCDGDFHSKNGSTYSGKSSSKNCIAKSKSAIVIFFFVAFQLLN